MLMFSKTEYPMCAVILLRDLDTQRVCRSDDLTNAQIMRLNVAHGIAGKVNSSNKLYHVIESVRPGTRHKRLSTVLAPADGAGGSPIG
jgi:hypothetical protein